MTRKILILLSTAFVIQGCAAPYSKYYYDKTGGVDITTNPRVIISKSEPKLYRGNDQEKDVQSMLENGYGMVGYSSFNGGNIDENGALLQAKKIHASVVIIYSKYTNTVSSVMPLTLPDTQTSTTTLYGNAYGSGGYANYSGTATTTTYGSETTYIPYSVNRYDHLATYWIKLKPLILGVQVKELTPEARNEMQSNKGVLVIVVTKGSPAFHSDLLEGDIIKKVDDIDIYDGPELVKQVSEHAGQKVIFTIYRNGVILKKEVQLNEKS